MVSTETLHDLESHLVMYFTGYSRGAEQASKAEQHEARQNDQTQGNSPAGIGDIDQSGSAS